MAQSAGDRHDLSRHLYITFPETALKSIGTHLFVVSAGKQAAPKPRFERVLARDLGLQETWFRDAIFDNPELVIAPCREAGRVTADETWLPWRIESNFGSGPIDVLLVSSYGRIGIVETKLSYNPQKRREVVAQVLDYALSLQDTDREDLPELPASPHAPDESDLVDALQSGKFLLVVAGDALDPRALRLSQALLARHLTNEWDLAMIDLNVYREIGADTLLVVPELLGTVQADVRQVVRVKVEGENPKAKVVVEHLSESDSPAVQSRGSLLVSIDAFLEEAGRAAPHILPEIERIVRAFEAVRSAAPGRIRLELKVGSMNLYRVGREGGQQRFLTIKTDGRMFVLFSYLRGAGHDEVADRLLALSTPFTVAPNQRRAYTVVKAANVEALVGFASQAAGLMTQSA
ncbi:hypothetical protein MMG85_15875 [Pseudoxanthomonas sp. LH2527]|uniref:hypothetical protein n=1 Tax=Pseudoxanthomonas sp. LH2527 TaxID=2923249 RepID=UPI001F146F86|nr:hypothetical protein [Pseudoxanthomonas sp. LH2527]MCH6485031.1 hypothetical protein [Pseudoxanthomonas sp. LH2527]